MDLLLTGEDRLQADQPNSLVKCPLHTVVGPKSAAQGSLKMNVVINIISS